MSTRFDLLLCWESIETNSWNPVLAGLLRERGHAVAEVHDLDGLRALDLSRFDVCLPRFRIGAAHMSCLDEVLVASAIPMLNTRTTRRRCENKALAHLAFEEHGVVQPPSLVLSDEGVQDRDVRWDGETIVKPLYGCRSAGIEICSSLTEALARGRARHEDLLLQQMIWPARCWRVVVGRSTGVVDPYWREPPDRGQRVLSVSTGSRIVRGAFSQAGADVAMAMLDAVDGDLLAVDMLERDGEFHALEINHNFDAHGGDEPAVEAFVREIERKAAVAVD